ncbi:MAG TPA: hypothetical protein EYG03_08525 [Planctomycetes bacterium]|nr:hypothetical protein [Fuerstiella sp.]HIK92011.1 hypothetical protein [Planctomycetota bacterium]
MRLLRLFLRIVMPMTLVTSSVVWLMSQSVFIMIRIPLPTGDLHLRADHEGWLLQLGNRQFKKRPTFEFHERSPGIGGWRDWMQDLNPDWLGSACVHAAWQHRGGLVISRFQLWGVKHYVVVLVSAAAVCILIRLESRQKRKTRTADSAVESEA